ncbi:MAG: FKBP-type peptidyl-prolyl cis-trans isomerase [Propioniciclava sp.]
MEKPVVTIPESTPPTDLIVEDLEVGTGPEAAAGQQVAVDYVGVAWSDGLEFDNSYDRGQPLVFQLGGQQVIAGWDTGIAGMKVGGRRRITIPPQLGYGAHGAGGAIRPNETLVFVCDLRGVA